MHEDQFETTDSGDNDGDAVEGGESVNSGDESVDIPLLEFANGIPGFPESQSFALIHTELAQEPFAVLRCLDTPELEFVVTTPHFYFPDYAPEIDDSTVERLGIEGEEDVLILLILTVGEEAMDITANLFAPIVINSKNRRGAQVILKDQDLPLNAPLFDKELIEQAQA